MPNQVQKYMNKISGPLMDRIDIQVEIEPVEFDDMASRQAAESSSSIRERVVKAREIQQERFKDLPGIHCNAQMTGRMLRRFAWPDEAGLAKLKAQMTKLNMSARAFDRILRVARTIADLESASNGLPLDQAITAPVEARHIAEAIGYRALDRPANFGIAF